MSVAFFWLFVLLLALGAPVVFALLISPGLSLVLDGETRYFPALLARLYNGIDSFPLLAVPFFILAGELMNSGGITTAIVRFAQSLVGHVRGGLAQVNILSSMLFAAKCFTLAITCFCAPFTNAVPITPRRCVSSP